MASKTKGSTRPKASKSKGANGTGRSRKTNPDLVETTSREAEAIEEKAGGAVGPSAAKPDSGPPRRSRRGMALNETAGNDVARAPARPEATPADTGSSQDGSSQDLRQKAGSVVKAATDGVRTGVAAVGEYGAALGEYGREGFTKASLAVRQGASAVGQAAAEGATRGREVVTRGRDAVARGWEAYPLAYCGAALAVGIVAGLLLPSTKVEDDLMGQAADRVNGRLRRAAGGLADTSKTLADKALSQAKAVTAEAAGDEGLTPQAIGQKVKRVAGRVKQAVAGAVETS